MVAVREVVARKETKGLLVLWERTEKTDIIVHALVHDQVLERGVAELKKTPR